MVSAPSMGTRRQLERKDKIFPSRPFLLHRLLVRSFLFCWREVRIEDREGGRISQRTVLWWPWDCGGRCKLDEGWQDMKTMEIFQQFSHPREPRHRPVARTPGNQKMQSVGGDGSKEAGRSDTQAPTKNYALWEHHKLLNTGYKKEWVLNVRPWIMSSTLYFQLSH